MAKTVFDKILDSTTGPKSYNWYKKEVSKITTPGARALINQGKATIRPKFGVMNLFGYDPKNKATLPLYDRFPLIMPLDAAKGGFYGLNLHYLPPKQRAILFDRLTDYASNKRYDITTRLRLNYQLLKQASKLSFYKPCFKHYLSANVRSKLVEVPADNWETVLFMPTENFKKKSVSTVWSDSRKMI